jgi:hypothetical protein
MIRYHMSILIFGCLWNSMLKSSAEERFDLLINMNNESQFFSGRQIDADTFLTCANKIIKVTRGFRVDRGAGRCHAEVVLLAPAFDGPEGTLLDEKVKAEQTKIREQRSTPAVPASPP